MTKLSDLKAAAAVALLVLAPACAPITYDPSGSATIDTDFHLTGFRWRGGSTVYIFAIAREKAGKTEVCAAYSPHNISYLESRDIDEIINALHLRSQGDTLVQGASFMNEITDHETALGKGANCVLTDRAWKPGYADEMYTKPLRSGRV